MTDEQYLALADRSWKPVMSPLGGYWPGLDPREVCEFGRDEWTETRFFRLADQNAYFNVGGLQWRSDSRALVRERK